MQASGDFSCVIEPVDQTIVKGASVVYTITTQAFDGYDGGILFRVSGLPADAVSFSKNPCNAGDTVIMTATTSSLKSNTTYVCTLSADGVARVE